MRDAVDRALFVPVFTWHLFRAVWHVVAYALEPKRI